MEPRRHKITSTERVECPKTGNSENLLPAGSNRLAPGQDECGGCGGVLNANNSDQYGLLTLASSLGSFLGLGR